MTDKRRAGRKAPAKPRSVSRRVRRPMTEIQKARYKALIDAEVSFEDIARECRRVHGGTTTRASVQAVFRDRARSVDVIEPIAARMLGLAVEELWDAVDEDRLRTGTNG